MLSAVVQKQLNEIAEQYAALSLQKKHVDAQLAAAAELLITFLGDGEQLVGDNFVITIAAGAPIKVWRNPEERAKLEAALLQRQLLTITPGKLTASIQLRGEAG